MDQYSIAALIFSVIYGILAGKNLQVCFVFGMIGSLIWAYADFAVYNLKYDGFLQCFYAVMSVVGFVSWNKKQERKITRIDRKQHILIIGAGVAISLALVYILGPYLNTALPLLDGTTTVFSVMATIMIIFRKIENWIYLLVCDLAYIYIYYTQHAYIFMVMMIVYSLIAMWGYYEWKGKMKDEAI